MPPVPSKTTFSLFKWLEKLFEYNRKRFPTQLTFRGRLALAFLRHLILHGKLYAFILKHIEIGEFYTPAGVKYKGFKFRFRW